MFSVTSLETAECHWSCLNLISTSFISTRLSSEKCQPLFEAYQDHTIGSTINGCHLLILRQESSMISNPEVANYWQRCRFLEQAMSTQQFKQPKKHFNHGVRYNDFSRSVYSYLNHKGQIMSTKLLHGFTIYAYIIQQFLISWLMPWGRRKVWKSGGARSSDAGTGGARGATGPPIFCRSVNPIRTGEGRLSPPITTGPPNVFHLPASLQYYKWLMI